MDGVPIWANTIMEIYFEIRPPPETQALYRRQGLTTFDYWKLELEWLLNSTWDATNAEFREMPGIVYLLQKYPGPKIQLDDEDRKVLWDRFIIELGMYPPIFPLKFEQFTQQPPRPSSSA